MGAFSVKDISVRIIDRATAKAYTLRHHYMRTFPNPVVCFGVMWHGKLCGVITFGYSTQSEAKVRKFLPVLRKNEFLEMQRMHLMDVLGANAESYALSLVMDVLRTKGLKAIITHAGGCKQDCGIVYQASAWLYFGKEPCNDFFLTAAGEYKNIIAPARFGRVPKGIKGAQAIGTALFGRGVAVASFRYTYIYPLQKGVRAYLTRKALPYPKDSLQFRRDQSWVTTQGGAQ